MRGSGMVPEAMHALALALVETAQRAGAAILAAREIGAAVRYKTDRSPVTDADTAAETIILGALGKLAPGIAVVAEEEVAAGKSSATGSTFFLVDALDGTREFVAGGDEFTVNIALVEDGVATFGLVYAPALRDCFVTLKPGVAVHFTLGPDGSKPAEQERLTGLPKETARAFTALTSRTQTNARTNAFLARFPQIEIKRMSSSLKFCVLAQGLADVSPRFAPTSAWDTAAGQAILEAAGGALVDETGAPLRYGSTDGNWINPNFIAWRRLSDGADTN